MSDPTIPAGPVRLAHDDLVAAELAAFQVTLLLNAYNPQANPQKAWQLMQDILRPRLVSASLRLRGELVAAGVKI